MPLRAAPARANASPTAVTWLRRGAWGGGRDDRSCSSVFDNGGVSFTCLLTKISYSKPIRGITYHSQDLSVHYNDKVKLKDGSQGSVKFIGEVTGKDGVYYGVDLVKGTGKNNGTVKKEVYFKTRGGKKSGIFCRHSKIKTAKPTEYSVKFTVGDHVMVKSKGNGVVRFVGVPFFSKVPKPVYTLYLSVYTVC